MRLSRPSGMRLILIGASALLLCACGVSALPTKTTDLVERQDGSRIVTAHFVVGIAGGYSADNWKQDINAAKDMGIEAFALNIAKLSTDSFTPTQLALAYSVAQSLNFKMYISFDFNWFVADGSSTSEITSYLQTYAAHPAALKRNGKSVVTTFVGDNFGGNWNNVRNQVSTPLEILPNWQVDTVRNNQGVVDGAFSWIAWPNSNNNPVPGPLSTAADNDYLSALGGKTYMAPVSPWFFTHFGSNTFSKNWIFASDDLYVTRWNQILSIAPPLIQLVTWNDFGESSYIGPYNPGHSDDGSGKWAADFPHDAWRTLGKPFVAAYKAGTKTPTVTEEKLVYWYRPHPKGLTCSDSLARPNGADFAQDKIFVATMLQTPGSIIVQSGNNPPVTIDVPAGIHLSSVDMAVGTQTFKLRRNGCDAISGTGGIPVAGSCERYNFNAFVGEFSPSGCQPPASSPTDSPAPNPTNGPVCNGGTGDGNFSAFTTPFPLSKPDRRAPSASIRSTSAGGILRPAGRLTTRGSIVGFNAAYTPREGPTVATDAAAFRSLLVAHSRPAGPELLPREYRPSAARESVSGVNHPPREYHAELLPRTVPVPPERSFGRVGAPQPESLVDATSRQPASGIGVWRSRERFKDHLLQHVQPEVAAADTQAQDPLAPENDANASGSRPLTDPPIYRTAPDTLFQPARSPNDADSRSEDPLSRSHVELPQNLYPPLTEQLMESAKAMEWTRKKVGAHQLPSVRESAEPIIPDVIQHDCRYDFWHPPMEIIAEAREYVLRYERYRHAGHHFFKTAISSMLARDLITAAPSALSVAIMRRVEDTSDIIHLLAALRLQLHTKFTIAPEGLDYLKQRLEQQRSLHAFATRYTPLVKPVQVHRAINRFRKVRDWYDSCSREPGFADSGVALLARSMPILLGRKLLGETGVITSGQRDNLSPYLYDAHDMEWFERLYADILFTAVHYHLDAVEGSTREAEAQPRPAKVKGKRRSRTGPHASGDSTPRVPTKQLLANATVQARAPEGNEIGRLLRKAWSSDAPTMASGAGAEVGVDRIALFLKNLGERPQHY
ncbi:hypothetical protein Dda_4354 [Drechslerella dactyloides]|uniref:Glycoside hydrolase family 71 protein n=1 Tax=Drechslerella dactyloides TaxID=74499 RepID=A0AAD6IWQ9_DREDA|nr:hypothetical protein Dda_4354 [Drechslerella dactyloides]